MSSVTHSFIFPILFLSFEQFVKSEPSVPLPSPAQIFSGNPDSDLGQQNPLSSLAYGLTQSLSDNSTFSPLLRKMASVSSQNSDEKASTNLLKYRKGEKLSKKFYIMPKTDSVNEISTNNAIFRSFREDNFDENYQRINETYFLEGNNSDMQHFHKFYNQEPPINESFFTSNLDRISSQQLSPLLSFKVITKTKPITNTISHDFEEVPFTSISLDSEKTAREKNRSLDINDINHSLRNNLILPDDNDDDQNPLVPEEHNKFEQKYPEITTTLSTLKYWEMQRTDSGQSIIKVTTATPTLHQTNRINELHDFSNIGNGNGIVEDSNWIEDVSLKSDDNVVELNILRKNPSLLSISTPQLSTSTTSTLINHLVSDDDLIAKTTTDETIFTTKSDLFFTALTSKQNQKPPSAAAAKMISANDITDFESSSTESSKPLTTGMDGLVLNVEESGHENLSLSPESDLLSIPTLHLSALPAPSIASDYNDLNEFPSISVFSSNDNDEGEQSESWNSKNSETTTNRNFYRKKENFDLLPHENVKLDKFNSEKITASLVNSQKEHYQLRTKQISTDKPVAKLSSSSDSGFGPLELSSILGNEIDKTFANLINFEKQQLGISIPKNPNLAAGVTIAQVPEQDSIDTVMTIGNKEISFKRGLMNGKVLERQKTFVAGKPVTLEMWNPIIYGHDWITNPAAVIHGIRKKLQAEIYNVEMKTKGINQTARTFGVRNFLDDMQTKKERKVEGMSGSYMEKLARACYTDDDDATDNDDQKRNILVMHTNKANNFLMNKMKGTGNNQQCFYVTKNCVLTATSPFERRIGMNLGECAQFCSSLPGCLSASFSSRFSICDTYHFKFGSRGKKMIKMAWHYYLEPQPSYAPGCSTESFLNQMTINKAFKKGKQSITNKPEEIASTGKKSRFPVYRDSSSLKNHGTDNEEYVCSEGENILLTKTPGWRIAILNGRKRRYFTSEEDCIQSCYRNKYKKTVYSCSSATFEKDSSRCNLYSTISPANYTLIRDTSAVHYEKNCFPRQIKELCDGALIERQPQRVLLTFPGAILTTSTLVNCLLNCFLSVQNGRAFQCHSLMYFYEQEVDNCILNSRSQSSQPDSLKEETFSAVDYFGLDECLDISYTDEELRNKEANPFRTHRYRENIRNFQRNEGSKFSNAQAPYFKW